VAGTAPNSALARANLEALLARYGIAGCELEIIDCITEPRRALTDGVLVTPTLVKASPGPVQMIVGTLSDTRRVVAALGLAAPAAEEPVHA
jgi:circadian clock protein KaiB